MNVRKCYFKADWKTILFIYFCLVPWVIIPDKPPTRCDWHNPELSHGLWWTVFLKVQIHSGMKGIDELFCRYLFCIYPQKIYFGHNFCCCVLHFFEQCYTFFLFVFLLVKSTGKCEKKKKKKSYVKKKDHRLNLCGPEGYVGKQVSKYEYNENW